MTRQRGRPGSAASANAGGAASFEPLLRDLEVTTTNGHPNMDPKRQHSSYKDPKTKTSNLRTQPLFSDAAILAAGKRSFAAARAATSTPARMRK